MNVNTFRRVEQKYLLTAEKKAQILERLKEKMTLDRYSPETICNIYFDTQDCELIQHSLEKPVYKEKVRLRSYNTPDLDSKVFLEIKKKFKGIVSKRRISVPLKYVYKYLNCEREIAQDGQISKELDYCFKKYDLHPTVYIAYDRDAYFGNDDGNFRVTFDYNIRGRDSNLNIEKGSYGSQILDGDKYVMEVKALDAFPLWFVRILTDLKIYPQSFSKYGEIYNLRFKNNYSYV